MKWRVGNGGLIALRAIVASGFIGAFLFTLVLSVVPQLHERIHEPGDATHQCAVTLLASGNCEHTAFNTIAIRPFTPKTPATLFCHHVYSTGAHLEFSLLEHAPPAFS
jgi:hypothetical protein